jgi:glycosyltransferase involved in cell wall biosynthesis
LLDASARSRLHIELVGYIHPDDRAALDKSTCVPPIVVHTERVSHSEAIGLMRRSHVLLLLAPFDYYPGKLFEYMAANRPVLMIGPDNIAADLVRRCGIGCAVEPDDIERLAQVLRQIALDYEGFVAEYYHPNWEEINRYDRKAQTQRLAALLDSLTTA